MPWVMWLEAGAQILFGCTKQGHQKPLDSKDDNTEKHCPVTVNPWHMKKAFKVMNELRSQNLLCDVTIVAEDMEISAHRVVLAACSPYFHAMFTGEMSESRAKRVRIKEVDGWTLRMLIDYVYTAEIQVTEENVQVLLPAAGLLQLQDVKKTCCEFLESQLHPVNCLGIRAFADMHACTDLLNKANTYAEQHFADVVLSEEFLNLGIEQVCSLISSDKLTISSEEKRVEEEALVKNSSACKDYLIEAMKYHLLPTEQRILMKSVRTRLRTPMNLPKLMVVVGGQAPKAIRSVECYDFKEERWHQVAELPSRRCRAGLSSVEAYNIKSNEWFHVAPMNTRRSSVGVGVVGGLLYAVGGYDGASRQCLSTVECYNATTNEWTYIAEMSTRRSGAGVGVLNNLLYAVGGHDGPLVRKSVEVYDPTTNTWRQVADMNMCRRNAGVCAVNGLLYVVGGDDGSCNLASVEYYNPTTDKWTVVSSCMSTGRSYAGVTVIDKPL
ncbi:kelch-like protein 2 isoform 2 [Lynx pardinus]|uniref:Kelch-like protein 2 isoform 2 n=1 Tax=Lynx pardinus TaxID=191816 RepID=A0A485N6R5_LYNPA|nr:kelch-like protein 2 isoform 2 [Lynx pardinus]